MGVGSGPRETLDPSDTTLTVLNLSKRTNPIDGHPESRPSRTLMTDSSVYRKRPWKVYTLIQNLHE